MTIKERAFVAQVWEHYCTAGRHTLLWRQTHDPYHIVVSEIMLQQTQVDRVLPKYETFIQQFSDIATLAQAPLSEVLKLWQGLGYNRRAKYLHACAKEVVEKYGGVFPTKEAQLRSLPGIGAYTAGAVLAFAYNIPVPIIETNIRTVFIHHFFKNKIVVTDDEIMRLVKKTLPDEKVRDWYYALMDYGSYLKQNKVKFAAKSRTYKKQSTFKGSNRQLRGAIIRLLVIHETATRTSLYKNITDFEPASIDEQLFELSKDGLITKEGGSYHLAT